MSQEPTRAECLRRLIDSSQLSFLMEAHSGLSAKIVEEAGYDGVWASGLSISAAHGVRDNNELSWTQVLDTLEFISESVSIPILVDGDTGYGNFNNVRRLVTKLESRGIAGVCLEDKLFPKANSFVDNSLLLANIDEFCGKIKAGKDVQSDPAFCIVARVEAFIAGCGLGEALKRADAYHRAGADAILIHSKLSRPDEVLSFKQEWGERCPVVIVPTKYYGTPTEVFESAGFSIVIWANHLVRSSIAAMQDAARTVRNERSLIGIEDRIAPIAEVFRLQGMDELLGAEKKYLPAPTQAVALILAASQGAELGDLTVQRPKALVPIAGKPLLERLTGVFNAIGISDITVVRGFGKNLISGPKLKYVDNDEYASTHQVYSFYHGIRDLTGPLLMSYGDILFDKYILMNLLESEADFCIAVDASWQSSANRHRYIELVHGDVPYSKYDLGRRVTLVRMSQTIDDDDVCGEWMGLLKASASGLDRVRSTLGQVEPERLRTMRMSELFQLLLEDGQRIEICYSHGRWFDVDELQDVEKAGAFIGENA